MYYSTMGFVMGIIDCPALCNDRILVVVVKGEGKPNAVEAQLHNLARDEVNVLKREVLKIIFFKWRKKN